MLQIIFQVMICNNTFTGERKSQMNTYHTYGDSFLERNQTIKMKRLFVTNKCIQFKLTFAEASTEGKGPMRCCKQLFYLPK